LVNLLRATQNGEKRNAKEKKKLINYFPLNCL
jgi:hypothetical protein